MGGEICAFEAFANLATQTWTKHKFSDVASDKTYMPWDGKMAQTGYDSDAILRCGVCGARMKLNKKDRKKGCTEQDKLNNHMRMLHNREQTKRQNWAKQSKKKIIKLSEKDFIKSKKHKAAQVGLKRLPNNDLFRILQESKIRCWSVHDADAKLINRAEKWISSLPSHRGEKRGIVMVAS